MKEISDVLQNILILLLQQYCHTSEESMFLAVKYSDAACITCKVSKGVLFGAYPNAISHTPMALMFI